MSKLIQGALILFAASLLAAGCGSDSKTKTDGSTVRGDKGSINIPDGGGGGDIGTGTRPDNGVIPGDQGTPQALSCLQIVACVNKCASDQACATQCMSQGSADGKAKFEALMTCVQGAVKGSCSTSCADPSTKECQDCALAACKTESDACQGTGGPQVPGFGDACDPAAQPTTCQAGLECKPVNVPEKGFCTKACPNPGEACSGAATGQLAACVLSYEGDANTYCAFICQLKDNTGALQSFQCPSTLTCAAEEDPPKSGQKGCDP